MEDLKNRVRSLFEVGKVAEVEDFGVEVRAGALAKRKEEMKEREKFWKKHRQAFLLESKPVVFKSRKVDLEEVVEVENEREVGTFGEVESVEGDKVEKVAFKVGVRHKEVVEERGDFAETKVRLARSRALVSKQQERSKKRTKVGTPNHFTGMFVGVPRSQKNTEALKVGSKSEIGLKTHAVVHEVHSQVDFEQKVRVRDSKLLTELVENFEKTSERRDVGRINGKRGEVVKRSRLV